jgi:hypothetical protein
MGAAACDARAAVTWESANRRIVAGNRTYSVNIPNPPPPTTFMTQHDFPGPGVFNDMVGSTSGGQTPAYAMINSNIDYANNSIVGAGTAGFGAVSGGNTSRVYGFASVAITATFTLDAPTMFVSDHLLGGNRPGTGTLTGPGVMMNLGAHGGPTHLEGTLAPGQYTYALFNGLSVDELPTFEGGGLWVFTASFQLVVPEPGGAGISVVAVGMSSCLRRGRRRASSLLTCVIRKVPRQPPVPDRNLLR